MPPGPVAFGPKPADPLIQAFYVEITQAYYREMIAHLRGLGVRIPLAGTNWAVHSDHLACQAVADFTDGHTYWWDFGGWNAKGRTFMNQAMVGQPSSILPPLAFNRLPDKPYFVSEWDNPWPNEWRAESALFLAAVGAFQGWGGFAIHTYRYDTDETTDQIGRPITSDAIGGVRYRGGVFDTFNDPAKYGLFYHAALITRRRDVAPARETLGIRLDGGLAGAGSAFRGAPEQHGVVSLLPRREPPAGVREVANQAVLLDEAAGEVRSDTGELYRSWSRRFGWINTPRTRAAYGFLGAQGEIRLSGLTIAAETDFATIALSSLTDAPLEESDSFLLTAVGRADNTGARYNADHTEQLDRGRGPILVEAVRAVLTLHTAQRALRAWSVNPRGFYIGNPPAEYRDGVYRLTIGGEFASMFYLIQSE